MVPLVVWSVVFRIASQHVGKDSATSRANNALLR
jgi:hypothetical protein